MESHHLSAGSLKEHLRVRHYAHDHPPVRNANEVFQSRLSLLDRIAVVITDKVGSMGFFGIIFLWTIVWVGYNTLAAKVPALGWKAFDPFPAFVAYLLISNVIQILLMPLIMVGQNVQGRHSEVRAELDFEINQKAEKELAIALERLEQNNQLLLTILSRLDALTSNPQEEERDQEHSESS